MRSAQKTLLTIAGFLLMVVFDAFSQVHVGGMFDLEMRRGQEDSKPYVNQTPREGLSLYTPHLRLFFDGDIDEKWGITAALQSDFYGRKELSPLFFSLLAVRWQPWLDRDLTFSAGRLIIPFGSYSERFLSAEHPFRHLPFSHEWTLPVDKIAGYMTGQRFYDVHPGMTMVYNRMYTQGISIEGFTGYKGQVNYRFLWGMASPSGFFDYAEHGMSALIGRITWQPAIYLKLGGSAGTGPYMKSGLANSMLSEKTRRSYRQYSAGFDTEISYHYIVLRLEMIANRWTAPFIEPDVHPTAGVIRGYLLLEEKINLDGSFYSAELVYRIKQIPGLSIVSRYEYASFADLKTETVYGSVGWFPEIHRVEAGLNYILSRSVKLKTTYLFTTNEGTDLKDDTFGIQLSISF